MRRWRYKGEKGDQEVHNGEKVWFQSEPGRNEEKDAVQDIVREVESRMFTVAQGIRVLEMAQNRIMESAPIKTNFQ